MSGILIGLPRGRLGDPFRAGFLNRSKPAATVLEAAAPALASLLTDRKLDAALLDAADALRLSPAIELIPGAAVRSFGRSGLAMILHSVPLPRVTALASPDPGGAPALLAHLLFRAGGRRPEALEGYRPPRGGIAAVVCGDAEPVLSGGGPLQTDLGEAWTALTGLPFVWAVWACRPGELDRTVYRRIHAALHAGLRADPHVRAASVSYRLGRRELDALRRFQSEAVRAELLPDRPPPRPARLAPGSRCDERAWRPEPGRGPR